MATYNEIDQRIGKHKGETLAHAIPVEVLGITGDHKQMPRNSGKTVIFRRWLPFGATNVDANSINRIDTDPAQHETEDGVTPDVDTLQKQDITVVLKQYAALYMYTDQVADLHEDNIPMEQKIQCGERMGHVREMIRYGVLRGCTNRFYGGDGVSRATVNAAISKNMLRRITKTLMANHGKLCTEILSPSAKFNTTAIEAAYLVFCSTDLENDIRELPGFKTLADYGSRKPMHEMELGSMDRYRFILSPELKGYADAGAAVGSTGLYSSGGSQIDVYPIIVQAKSAWADVSLRGRNSFGLSHVPLGKKDSADPLGQRGYVGCKFYDAAFIQNDGWMAVAEVGAVNI